MRSKRSESASELLICGYTNEPINVMLLDLITDFIDFIEEYFVGHWFYNICLMLTMLSHFINLLKGGQVNTLGTWESKQGILGPALNRSDFPLCFSSVRRDQTNYIHNTHTT